MKQRSKFLDPFQLYDALPEDFREFMDSRFDAIASGDTPLKLRPGAIVTLHLIPEASLKADHRLSLQPLIKQSDLQSLSAAHWNQREINGHGLVFWGPPEEPVRDYIQVAWNGIIEAVHSTGAVGASKEKTIYSVPLRESMIVALASYLKIQKEILKSEPAFFLIVTFQKLTGVEMIRPRDGFGSATCFRQTALFPEPVRIDSWDVKPTDLLQPAFTKLWNAVGAPEPPNTR